MLLLTLNRWFKYTKWPNGDVHVLLGIMHLIVMPRCGRANLDRIPSPFLKRGLNQTEMWRMSWIFNEFGIRRVM